MGGGGRGLRPPGSRLPDRCPSSGSTEQFILLNKMKNFEAKAFRQSEKKCYNVVKVVLLQRGEGRWAPRGTPERRPPVL